MPDKKPVCFIAMAFGKADTDAFYEKLILPVLRKKNITPIIINRRESNDDLNNQIFEQLNNCNFCIADLTYARPSVYFEAGFAQRAVPVIYTVRKDHLSPQQPDNLRVHFDLQMRPLIVWADPDDSSFSSKLESRINSTILKEWHINHEKLKQTEAEEKRFSDLSLNSRLALLKDQAVLELEKRGFNGWESVDKIISSHISYDDKYLKDGIVNNIYCLAQRESIVDIVTIQSYEALTKTELEKLKKTYNSGGEFIYRLFDKSARSPKSFVYAEHFIFCLKPLSSDRIESVLASFSPIERAKIYFIDTNIDPVSNEKANNTLELKFFFISGIRSIVQFNNQLSYLLQKYVPKYT